MSGKLPGLQKRLAKIEQDLANIVKREDLKSCNCREITIAISGQPEEFEAEMNLTCPVHGLRSLGQITCLVFVNPDGSEGKDSRLDQLLATYDARQIPRKKLRLSQLRQISQELEI